MRHTCSERFALGAMGTRFELVVGRADGAPASGVRAIAEDALELIREWDRRLSLFDRGSLVSHVNARAVAGWVRVDAEMMDLLAACARLWRETDGVFDPSVGAVMRRRGLQQRRGIDAEGAWGFAHAELDEATSSVRFARPGIELDFGGIAKGFVLDLVAQRLRESGVTSALVHGGTSSVLAIGEGEGGEEWAVALGDVDGPRVAVGDAAMSVSAGQVTEGGRIGHVVDPRTGAIVEPAASACVIGASAMACEAWSTALLVLGARPVGMEPGLTSVVRTSEGAPWTVGGDDAWRVSNVRDGVAAA